MAITSRAPAPGGGVSVPPDGPPGRSTAWAEGVERLREAATTEPGRLRIIGAVLAALIVLFGTVSVWEISGRSTAADDVVGRSQPLSADAASIYRSLADADTTSSSGFLLGVRSRARSASGTRRTSPTPPSCWSARPPTPAATRTRASRSPC